MDKKMILTIGRQFGCGGREIGQLLAKEFGITYYDKELLAVAAKESGLCEDVFEKADEHAASSLSYAFALSYSSFLGGIMPFNDLLSNDGLFKIQSDAIRNLAEKEPCVLVGRCADYILRDNPNCFSFFVHGSPEFRIHKIVERQNVTVEEAKELMEKTDKTRAAYYNYYTNKEWGVASSYNLSIDASILGVEKTVAFMKQFVESKLNQ